MAQKNIKKQQIQESTRRPIRRQIIMPPPSPPLPSLPLSLQSIYRQTVPITLYYVPLYTYTSYTFLYGKEDERQKEMKPKQQMHMNIEHVLKCNQTNSVCSLLFFFFDFSVEKKQNLSPTATTSPTSCIPLPARTNDLEFLLAAYTYAVVCRTHIYDIDFESVCFFFFHCFFSFLLLLFNSIFLAFFHFRAIFSFVSCIDCTKSD